MSDPLPHDPARPVSAPPTPKLRELFGIDPRSLAFFRIGLGLLLLADLVKRSLAFRDHYTGEGILPRAEALTLEPDWSFLHLYLLSDDARVQAGLFVIAGLLALAFTVGYRTRLVSVLSFLMLVSLVRRNPFVTHTGDTYLQAIVFWAMFLPLGRVFSVDRLRGRARALDAAPFVSMGTIGVLCQIFLFYHLAGVLKHGYEVWDSGEALFVFANISEYTRPFASVLGGYPTICRWLTFGTLILEAICPFLLFSPIFTAPVRTLLVFAFAAFHVGIQLAVYIGIFEILSIVAVCLFLPAAFWERLGRLGPVRRGVDALAARLPAPAPPPPAPGAGVRAFRTGAQALAGAALLVVTVSNLNLARAEGEKIPVPEVVDDFARPLGLMQNWNIFNDIGDGYFGWYLALGQTESGRIVNVLERRDFAGLRAPEEFAARFRCHNERRFWVQAMRPGQDYMRELLARFVIQDWNRDQADALTHLALFHVGNVPGQGETTERLKQVVAYAPPQPRLKDASEELRARAARDRKDWQRFVASLPKFLRVSDPEAVAIAERVLAATGGRAAWDRARHLTWRHNGERRHVWDRHTGDLRVESEDLVVLLNLGTRAGRAFRGAVEITEEEVLRTALDQAYAWWSNDSYWVLMPVKLLDDGVVLTLAGEDRLPDGRAADVLELTFEGVGRTPRNRYLVHVARDTGLVEQWSYFARLRDRKPAWTKRWGPWERHGELLLANGADAAQGWELALHAELPRSVYTDPAPQTLPAPGR